MASTFVLHARLNILFQVQTGSTVRKSWGSQQLLTLFPLDRKGNIGYQIS